MAFTSENTEVYRTAASFGDRVAALTEGFPGNGSSLGHQLKHIAGSIEQRLAEASGHNVRTERINCYMDALKAVRKCVPLLAQARRQRLLDAANHAALRGELDKIVKGLGALAEVLEKKRT